jgi:hypothetical protein
MLLVKHSFLFVFLLGSCITVKVVYWEVDITIIIVVIWLMDWEVGWY